MDKQVESMLRGGQFHKILESYISKIRKKYDLKKTEVEVLYYLAKAGKENASKDVISFLNMNKGHISITLDSLCGKDYIQGTQDMQDHRVIHYEVTEHAAEIVKEIEQVLKHLYEELFLGVSQEDKEALERVALQLKQNINRMEKEV